MRKYSKVSSDLKLAVHRSSIFVLTLQYGESLFSFLRNLSTSSFNTFLRFFTTRLKPKNTFLLYPCHLSAPPLPQSCSTLVTFLLLHPCHTFAPTDLPIPQFCSSGATAPHPLFPVTLLQLCSSYNTWPLFTLPLLLPFLCHIVSSDLPLFSCYFNFHDQGRILRCYKKIKNLLNVLLTA